MHYTDCTRTPAYTARSTMTGGASRTEPNPKVRLGAAFFLRESRGAAGVDVRPGPASHAATRGVEQPGQVGRLIDVRLPVVPPWLAAPRQPPNRPPPPHRNNKPKGKTNRERIKGSGFPCHREERSVVGVFVDCPWLATTDYWPLGERVAEESVNHAKGTIITLNVYSDAKLRILKTVSTFSFSFPHCEAHGLCMPDTLQSRSRIPEETDTRQCPG